MASLNSLKAWGLLHGVRRRALIVNASSDEKEGRERRKKSLCWLDHKDCVALSYDDSISYSTIERLIEFLYFKTTY